MSPWTLLSTCTGTALVLALNLLQVHRRSAAEGVWLAVPLLAAAATVVGLLYPLALSPTSAPDGSTVMRCLAVFVGIYLATTVSLTYTHAHIHLLTAFVCSEYLFDVLTEDRFLWLCGASSHAGRPLCRDMVAV